MDSSKKKQTVSILEKAFSDNGSVNYVVGKKTSRIRRLMKYSYVSCLAGGGVVFHESGEAVLLYKLPGITGNTFQIVLEEIKLALHGIGLLRIPKVLKREAYISRHKLKDSHVYLWFIGTNPDHQGKGFGTSLMKNIISLSNQMGLPVCLETSNPKNLPFYEHFGFEVYHTSSIEELGYRLWFMKKEKNK